MSILPILSVLPLLSICSMNIYQYCPDIKCDTLQMLQVKKVLISEQEALQKTPVLAHSGVHICIYALTIRTYKTITSEKEDEGSVAGLWPV